MPCWRASWGLSLEGSVSRRAATDFVLRNALVVHVGSNLRADSEAYPWAFVLVLL